MSISSRTRSEATVTCALVRPISSMLVIRPLKSTTLPSGGAPHVCRKARSRWTSQPSNRPRCKATRTGTPPIVSVARAAIVTCCWSTSRPVALLKVRPSTSSESAAKTAPSSAIGRSALVTVRMRPERRVKGVAIRHQQRRILGGALRGEEGGQRRRGGPHGRMLLNLRLDKVHSPLATFSKSCWSSRKRQRNA